MLVQCGIAVVLLVLWFWWCSCRCHAIIVAFGVGVGVGVKILHNELNLMRGRGQDDLWSRHRIRR